MKCQIYQDWQSSRILNILKMKMCHYIQTIKFVDKPYQIPNVSTNPKIWIFQLSRILIKPKMKIFHFSRISTKPKTKMLQCMKFSNYKIYQYFQPSKVSTVFETKIFKMWQYK